MHVCKSQILERHRSVRRCMWYAFLQTKLVRTLQYLICWQALCTTLTNTIFDFGYAQNDVICGHLFAYRRWLDVKKRCTFRRTVLHYVHEHWQYWLSAIPFSPVHATPTIDYEWSYWEKLVESLRTNVLNISQTKIQRNEACFKSFKVWTLTINPLQQVKRKIQDTFMGLWLS